MPEGDYDIKVPEGMAVDTDAVKMVEPLARELGLSGEGMNKLVGVYAEQVLPHVTERVIDGIQKDIVATHAQWATDAAEMVKTDPSFAGKSMSDVQQVAAKALDRLATPEFRTFLAETGLGNHPEMVKAFYNAGSAISEDTTFERGGAAPATKSRTDKYYPPAQTS